MRDVVICSPLRTPVGRYGGALRGVPAQELAATVIRAVLDRTGLDGAAVDDVILGQGYGSADAPAIGRVAALDAGLPTTVTGTQVDRRCSSGLYAVLMGAMQVQTGASDVVLAGGTESMSRADHFATGLRFEQATADVTLHDSLSRARVMAGGSRFVVEGGMLETAENLREEHRIPREEQDELALASHQRAVAAQEAGSFDEELVPVTVEGRKETVVVDADEHPRAETTLEQLAKLPPVRAKQDPESTVTAGNASGQNDGAAVCVVTSPETAESHGLTPLLRLVSWGTGGVDPRTMGMGPVPSTEVALERAGLRLADIDLIELNEAFAAQVLSVTRAWGFGAADFERLNVNGSGISLGHPVGATGARILATLAHELHRRQARYGLETMCVGGGQGVTAVFERLA